MKEKNNKFLPLIMALCVVIGVIIGVFYTSHYSGSRLSIINSSSNKLNNLLHIIDDQYVDTVNLNDLVESAIPELLASLDPHSTYVTASEMQSNNDALKGSFSGVGISFVIRDDTLHVQNVIANGPAEKSGIVAGDKIVAVNGKTFCGKNCTNEEAMRKLKGPKGSKVKLGILHYRSKKVETYIVTRDDIPQKSISASYMINKETGYIRIKNFGETTYAEMLVALAKLSTENAQNLIIDLRDNTGGYLASAVQILNEFLQKNRLIVYTEGRKSPRQEYRSDGRGSYQHMPIVVLINDVSASASEIFAGAIQDNDRGMVIGRRSFGKGLVQQPIQFPDGSEVRLTIARYFTPSGRCIQKPYEMGDETYGQDLLERYKNGEYFSKDSIKNSGPAYKTSIGRIVYGGGGITPDIFVAEDTSAITPYYTEAIYSGRIFTFAYNYVDDNRAQLDHFADINQLVAYLKRHNIVDKFATYANENGLKRRNLMIKRSHRLLEDLLISRIIYNNMDETALCKFNNIDDQVVATALKVFKTGKAFPKNTE